MLISVGSEWCHNFAHAAAAWWVRKPMDAMRIFWGTPLLVYFDIEDPSVTPKEHIIRALGGPLFNAAALVPVTIWRTWTRPASLARELLDVALASNLFLLLAGLLPLPGIDGGPILKWSLVARGRTPSEADQIVRQVDGVLAIGLGAAAYQAAKKKNWLFGVLFGLLGLTSLVVSLGWLQERTQADPGTHNN
jgi:Zn-dependent protease